MSAAVRGDFEISVAPSALQAPALALVLSEIPDERRAPHVERLLAGARDGEPDLTGLLIACQGPALAGAIWARRQPGRVATVWPPVVVDPQSSACAEALTSEAVAWLARSDVRVAQALVPIAGDEQAAPLRRAGFEHLADLLYMVSLTAEFPVAPPELALLFEPVAAGDVARLASIVEQTYAGTLDCPRLNGVRDINDVLAGYRACGAAHPAPWLVARRDERDVGCLLLADHPEENQWEIVYAGLVPVERGRGHGLALVRRAQWDARQAGRARLALAVDAANAPAVKTYVAAGFQTWDRRRALVRVFPNGGAAT